MQNPETARRDQAAAHVVYDKVTGQILGRFRRYDAVEGRLQHAEPDETLEAFRRDATLLARVTDGDPGNLAVAISHLASEESARGLRVAPATGAVEALPRIRLFSDREALDGDGEDTLTLSIDVVGEGNAVVSSYIGEIKVSTTNGKLSARAGLVTAQGGRAGLTLTSTRETIDEVRIRARATDGTALPGELTVRFE
jgi:hypothetical protein